MLCQLVSVQPTQGNEPGPGRLSLTVNEPGQSAHPSITQPLCMEVITSPQTQSEASEGMNGRAIADYHLQTYDKQATDGVDVPSRLA